MKEGRAWRWKKRLRKKNWKIAARIIRRLKAARVPHERPSAVKHRIILGGKRLSPVQWVRCKANFCVVPVTNALYYIYRNISANVLADLWLANVLADLWLTGTFYTHVLYNWYRQMFLLILTDCKFPYWYITDWRHLYNSGKWQEFLSAFWTSRVHNADVNS